MTAKTTKTRKAKGREFQKYIAGKISKLLDIPVEKDGEIESRPMGLSGPDIILRGNARKSFDYFIECKRAENWSVHDWIKQAKIYSKNNNNWLLFCKRNRRDAVVIMNCDMFFELYKKILDK